MLLWPCSTINVTKSGMNGKSSRNTTIMQYLTFIIFIVSQKITRLNFLAHTLGPPAGLTLNGTWTHIFHVSQKLTSYGKILLTVCTQPTINAGTVCMHRSPNDAPVWLLIAAQHSTYPNLSWTKCMEAALQGANYYTQTCVSDMLNGCRMYQICDQCVTEMRKIWAVSI